MCRSAGVGRGVRDFGPEEVVSLIEVIEVWAIGHMGSKGFGF